MERNPVLLRDTRWFAAEFREEVAFEVPDDTFLVVDGEALVIVDGEERPLQPWDELRWNRQF